MGIPREGFLEEVVPKEVLEGRLAVCLVRNSELYLGKEIGGIRTWGEEETQDRIRRFIF